MKLDKADKIFSEYIRTRDNWTCQRCKTKYIPPTIALHCSHYFGRGKESTRYDPRNCVALCFGCHRIWGSDNREDYRNFMIKLLGKKEFEKLRLRSEFLSKKDRSLSFLYAKKLLESLK